MEHPTPEGVPSPKSWEYFWPKSNKKTFGPLDLQKYAQNSLDAHYDLIYKTLYTK